jgi:hypothetical protein
VQAVTRSECTSLFGIRVSGPPAANSRFGIRDDLRYPQFYWNGVAPHVQTAIRYLNVTSSGRQWIAKLYSNVFRVERDISLSGRRKS